MAAAIAVAMENPVHMLVARSNAPPAQDCVIRLSLSERRQRFTRPRWRAGNLAVGGECGDAAVGCDEFVVEVGVSGDAVGRIE